MIPPQGVVIFSRRIAYTAAAFATAWLVTATVVCEAAWSELPEQRPNFLLIVSDDQRPDTIRALGNSEIETPHLDALVRTGTTFTRATCAFPLCVPSRAELLTGRTAFRNGFQRGRLDGDLPTLPATLRAAGYRTWYVGKWHTTGRPSQRGYTAVDGLFASGKAPEVPQLDRHGRPVTGYVGWQFQTNDRHLMPEKGVGLTANISSEFADAAIRFLDQAANSPDPFFLHVNFTAPHDPRIMPPGYEAKYDPKKISLPINFRPEHPFDHGNERGRDELLLDFPRSAEQVRDELAVYYAVISHMDQQIGRVIRKLDDMGLGSNTIVIFTSDHGLALGSHGLIGKQNMYEHTIGVPLIFRGPGIAAGERRQTQCYLRDLFPTICDLASVPVPPALDARSLRPAIQRDGEVYPFIVGYFFDAQRMIRKDHWKLIVYPKLDREQLFDLRSDPNEVEDLAESRGHSALRSELKRELTEWLTANGDPQ